MEQVCTERAIENLIQDYGKLVFHLIYSLTGEWEESQDLTQETFLYALRAINAARRARGEHFQAKAWLMRIAVNTARMYLRRRRLIRFSSLSQMAQDEAGENESWQRSLAPVQPAGYATHERDDPAEALPERDAVARTLARMPESLRIPLLLATVAGFSTREVAAQLNLNEVSVRQRLSRAKRAFQQLYSAESGEEASSGTGRLVRGKAKHPAGSRSDQRIRDPLKPSWVSQDCRQLPATA